VYPGNSELYGVPTFEGTLLRYIPLAPGATKLDGPAQIEGDLASSYQLSPTGITLTLRSAKAPNGDVLTPEDVQWTFQREIGVADPVGLFFLSIAGISTTDPVTILGPHEVRINGHITPLGLIPLVNAEFDIIDSKLAKQHATASDPWAKAWLANHSAGYGPYSVSAFAPSASITLAANPNYWGGEPSFHQVIITPVSSTQSAAELLKAGTIGGALDIPFSQFHELTTDPNIKTLERPRFAQDVLELNEAFAPFKNVDVRRAISMAIDRPALVEGPYSGTGKPSVSVVSQAIPGVTGTSQYYTYNLSAAKALLASTPYKGGFSVTLSYNQAEVSSVDVSSLAINLASELGQLGIHVTLSDVASDAILRAGLESNKYAMFLLLEGPVAGDADYDLNLFHVTKAESNFTGESNPQIDQLVKEAGSTPIGPQRDALIDQAISIWNQEMYDVPLVQVSGTDAFASYVCGLAPAFPLVQPYLLTRC
jgi:peptide/nickel transport system substrate-binding protein